MAVLQLAIGAKISGANERGKRSLAPVHNHAIRGRAAMAYTKVTSTLCLVCSAKLQARSHSPCCSDACRHARRNLMARLKRAETPEKYRLKCRRWYCANPEKMRERTKARAHQTRATSRRFYENNRDRLLASQKANHATVSANAKRWREANKDKERVRSRKKQMDRRATTLTAFVENIDPAVVYQRAKGICGICHKPIDAAEKWHVDHIEPLSKGGAHSYDNVQPAHARCNISKGAKIQPGQGVLFRRAG